MSVVEEISSDALTAVAILSLTYLGAIGVSDTFLLGAIAGLGGYRIFKRRGARRSGES